MLSPYSSNEYHPENTNTTWHKMVGMVPTKASVLDIGCSTGKLGAVLKEVKEATVVGIDITEDDVALAKKHLDDAFVFDIENSPLDDKRFDTYDCIVFADVLEHMKDPVKVLEKVKQLLKPGGRLIFSIPNMAHMFVRLQLLEGSFRYTETGLLDYTHLHFYDNEEVDRIFKDANYVIRQYDCTTFDYPKELLDEKLSKVGLKATKEFYDIAHSKEAVIFEYVGWAEPVKVSSHEKHVPLGTSSPMEEVLAFVQRVKDAEHSSKNELQVKIEASEAHIKKLEALQYQMQTELEALKKEAESSKTHPVKSALKHYIKKD